MKKLSLIDEQVIPGSLVSRRLPDGQYVSLQWLTFGRLRLCVGQNTEEYGDFW
jgi:hypothetical protein